MKRIATMTLAALLSALAPGCGSGSASPAAPKNNSSPAPTTQTATPVTPTSQVFGEFIDASPDGSYAVVRDTRLPSYGQLLSVETATGRDTPLQVSPTSVNLITVVGNEGILQEKSGLAGQQSDTDIVVTDVKTGKVTFDINTPIQREWFVGIAGQDIVFTQHDNSGNNNVGMLHLPTKKTRVLSTGKAYVANQDDRTITAISSLPNLKDSLVLIDRTTGATSTAIDLNTDPDAIGFFDRTERDIVSYRTFSHDIIFRFLNGQTSSFTPPNNPSSGYAPSYDVLAMSANAQQAIVKEYDPQTQQSKLFHLFLYGPKASHHEIDLTPAGLSIDELNGFLICPGRIMLRTYRNSTNQQGVIFYEPGSRRLADLVTPELRTGTAREVFTYPQRDDSAALDVLVDNNGSLDRQQMVFDGWSVNAPFAQADSSYQMATTPDGAFAAVLARRGNFTDIYALDVAGGAAFPLDSTPRNIGSVQISQDGKTVAYAVNANQDHGLYVATTGWTLPRELSRSVVPVYPIAFTRDGKSIFAEGSSGPRKVELIDIATGVTKHVCNK